MGKIEFVGLIILLNVFKPIFIFQLNFKELFSFFQFNNWAPGQPNGSVKADGFGTEACTALLQKNGVFKW
jgi:hypothetical protein